MLLQMAPPSCYHFKYSVTRDGATDCQPSLYMCGSCCMYIVSAPCSTPALRLFCERRLTQKLQPVRDGNPSILVLPEHYQTTSSLTQHQGETLTGCGVLLQAEVHSAGQGLEQVHPRRLACSDKEKYVIRYEHMMQEKINRSEFSAEKTGSQKILWSDD